MATALSVCVGEDMSGMNYRYTGQGRVETLEPAGIYGSERRSVRSHCLREIFHSRALAHIRLYFQCYICRSFRAVSSV